MEGKEPVKITINASEIIGRLRNKQDRQNFCQEMNWYCPQEPGYDATYFLKVCMGEKKYLPINFNIGYKMKFFKKGITLNKKYIISKMLGNPAYAAYTPDNTNIEKLSRDFLLNLVAYVDPELYKNFYSIYKAQTMERNYSKWSKYTIDVKPDIIQKIKEFIPIGVNQAKNRSFQLTKNHINNNTFKEKRNDYQQINFISNESSKLSIIPQKAINNSMGKSIKNKNKNSNQDKDIEMNLNDIK